MKYEYISVKYYVTQDLFKKSKTEKKKSNNNNDKTIHPNKPEEGFSKTACKRSRFVWHSIHAGINMDSVLYEDGKFTVSATKKASIIYVRGSNDDAKVVDDHELTVNIDKLSHLKLTEIKTCE